MGLISLPLHSWLNLGISFVVILLYGIGAMRVAGSIESEHELSLRDIGSLFRSVWGDKVVQRRELLRAWLLRLCLIFAAAGALLNLWQLNFLIAEAPSGWKNFAWRVWHIVGAGVVICVDGLVEAERERDAALKDG